MIRHRTFVWAAFLLSISAARGQDCIWLEGEEPTTKNVEVKAEGWGRTELLSGGKWLFLQIDQEDLAKKLPKEGARLGYDFQVSSGGNYEVWSRIGWEGIRAPFDWRIDQGPWGSVKPDYPTTDHVDLATWCPLGWMKLGQTNVAAGKHTFEFRLSPWSKQENGKDVAQRIMFACDATCLTRGPFRANGKHRPGEDWQDATDKQAARHASRERSGTSCGLLCQHFSSTALDSGHMAVAGALVKEALCPPPVPAPPRVLISALAIALTPRSQHQLSIGNRFFYRAAGFDASRVIRLKPH
jgi:hypothetical protein